MSMFNEIKIIDCSKIEKFLSEWNNAEENSILLLLSNNCSITYKKEDIDRIKTFFKNSKIGFIYTDVMTNNKNNIKNIEYLNGIDLPNIAFFAKKINNISFNEFDDNNIMIELMKTYLSHGYYFHHIADPLINMNI